VALLPALDATILSKREDELKSLSWLSTGLYSSFARIAVESLGRGGSEGRSEEIEDATLETLSSTTEERREELGD
jgi:hypothetical protein